MSFARQITTRSDAAQTGTQPSEPRSVSASVQAASRPPIPPRAWAEQFMKAAAVAELSTNDAVAILRECDTFEAASGRLSQKLAAGQGLAAARPAAQSDTAARLLASHAKAHQPTGRMRQR